MRNKSSKYIWILSFLLLGGLACRIYDLGRLPLLSDEAESSINAFTILQKGVPGDSYQGQPLFENVMVRRWPDNPEFEFRDISYSDRHIAAYHGWLPLYAIALSFRLFGITSSPAGMLRPQYDEAERLRRTIAARLPSVFFGLLCIVAIYLVGCRLQGRETGLVAALLTTFLAININFSQTASITPKLSPSSHFAFGPRWSCARVRGGGIFSLAAFFSRRCSTRTSLPSPRHV